VAIFGRKSRADTSKTGFAIVHLNARLQPKHRGEYYEDPLDEVLASRAPGSHVVGGGTSFSQETGQLSCDIEVDLSGDPATTMALVIEVLEFYGAPVGSSYRLDDAEPVSFGVTHGYALSLDGTSLPDEVYATHDVNELIGALTEELGDSALLQSWWEGPERTQFYFYGRDAGLLKQVLESATARFPLAERSTVFEIT
jgi:hypothetical protein